MWMSFIAIGFHHIFDRCVRIDFLNDAICFLSGNLVRRYSARGFRNYDYLGSNQINLWRNKYVRMPFITIGFHYICGCCGRIRRTCC